MNNKAVLCIDCRMINHSGIGNYIKNLIPHLVEKYDIILLGDTADLISFKAKAIIALKSKIYSITEQFELFRKIPKCDLFWSPHYNIPLLPIKAKHRVVTIHDVYHLAFYNDLPAKQKAYARLVINAAAKLSNEVITVSDFSKNEIIKYTSCSPDKIQVIHNGVGQYVTITDGPQVAESYDLPDNYILFVGNVKPHKNLKTLLMAYQLLSEELKLKYKVVIVGKRNGFLTGDEELTRWINENNDIKDEIIFTGYVADNDMNALYNNAALFVFPSIYEGFGIPPLEAMLNKCPVIAAETSSIPEICGDAVLYFNATDKTELANNITRVLTDKEINKQLTTKGLQRIKLFNWGFSANKHIEIFNRLTKS